MAEFREQVYGLVSRIPVGRVLAYGDVAVAIGHPGAARQVGWALAALRGDHGVPWQRVILSTGAIAFKGDPVRGPLQRRLLEQEGVVFNGDRVPMKEYRWDLDLL